MTLVQWFSWSCFFALISSAQAVQTFSEDSEQDLPLRRQTPLYLHHSLGSVQVQGWVQDRIRVTLKKRMIAETEADAKKEFQKLELVSLESPQSFEIRVGKNRGADIVTKLREDRGDGPVTVDLEIRAPYQSDLTVVLGDHRSLTLTQWRGKLTVNGREAEVHLGKLTQTQPLQVNCPGCSIEISESKIQGHLFSGGKQVSLHDVEAIHPLSVDSGAGDSRLDVTRGRMEVHTSSGRLTSSNHQGAVSFESKEGGLFISGLNGNLEAQTQSGQLMVEVDQVQSYLQLDSQKGDIQVSLPPKFEGNLDLFSLRGEVVVQFPTQLNPKLASETYGPSSPGRIDGFIGTKNQINVHAYTREGGVRLLRKVPK